MYYIGLDVHKRTISYCVKDAAGRVHMEGKIGSTRRELDGWIKTLPQPRTIAMEATIFTGWIYDHLLPHAEKVKVAHPLMLRAIAAAKRKNDKIDASKIADCLVARPKRLISGHINDARLLQAISPHLLSLNRAITRGTCPSIVFGAVSCR
jgi:hypothetical protein